MKHHRAQACCLSMIFSENRCTLFRIMLQAASDGSPFAHRSTAAGSSRSWFEHRRPPLAAPGSTMPALHCKQCGQQRHRKPDVLLVQTAIRSALILAPQPLRNTDHLAADSRTTIILTFRKDSEVVGRWYN
jgi:hypothetical protein